MGIKIKMRKDININNIKQDIKREKRDKRGKKVNGDKRENLI